jgi:molybdenum cofactor synthesis domain-containing protein
MAKSAGIVLVGNEILSGKVEDRNAVYLCREFRALGVDVRKIAVIPDEVEAIAQEVGEFAARHDWVFTSGGVGPTHDDVTIAGVARAFGVRVVRDPGLVAKLEATYRDRLNEARLKMAEVPEGAVLLDQDDLVVPVVVMRNVHVLPGVPEIFRRKFDAIKERFRDQPYLLRTVYVRVGEGALAAHLNGMLERYPALLCGSYPELFNPDYKVRVTLESKEPAYLDAALEDLLARLPPDAVVRVQ